MHPATFLLQPAKCTSEQHFDSLIESSYLSIVQPDLAKWGGLTKIVPVAKKIIAAGKRYCPHYLGGGVGLLASAHALAAVGGEGILEVDINQNPLRTIFVEPVSGVLKLGDAPARNRLRLRRDSQL